MPKLTPSLPGFVCSAFGQDLNAAALPQPQTASPQPQAASSNTVEQSSNNPLDKAYQKALSALNAAYSVVSGIASVLYDLEKGQKDVSARLSERPARYIGRKRKLSPSVYDYSASNGADTPTQVSQRAPAFLLLHRSPWPRPFELAWFLVGFPQIRTCTFCLLAQTFSHFSNMTAFCHRSEKDRHCIMPRRPIPLHFLSHRFYPLPSSIGGPPRLANRATISPDPSG